MIESVLLDTHSLIWWLMDDRQLSANAGELIENPQVRVSVSAATLWEIAIKNRKGTLSGCEEYLSSFRTLHQRWGFATMDLQGDHVVCAGELSWSHRDPFDRALVAQSKLAKYTLLTCDETIRAYHPDCWW